METLKDDSSLTYKKLSYNLLTIVLIGLIVYLGKAILLPILFSILLATVLHPAVNFLQRKKFPRFLSIMLPVLTSLLVIGGILYLLSVQIAHFFDDFDALKDRVNELTKAVQKWVASNLNITPRKQAEYISETAEKVKTEGPKIAGRTVLSITESLTYIVLLPIYTFLILYYRNTIKRFFIELFKGAERNKVVDILHSCSHVSLRYITGLLIETTIVFSLNAIGFLILGIEYAIFLALLAALLNIVPYIGILIANIFCVAVTFLTADDPTKAIWVAVILAIVQFFDNNIGMPLIVGNNVRINALATIVGVLVGGALCGVPGMFLAIPGLAVMKVIFDRVEKLEAWGILLGDESDDGRKDKKPLKFLKPKSKKKKEVSE